MRLPQVQVKDLVVTKEGQVTNSVEVIKDYFNMQGTLESSMQLPHQPINVGVAADAHRYMVCTVGLDLMGLVHEIIPLKSTLWDLNAGCQWQKFI